MKPSGDIAGQKRRILLVEDEPHLAFSLKFNLEAEGYDVIAAENGRIALERFANAGPFDLAILDVMLPEIDGFEVAKRARAADPQMGILMLTARASENDRITGLQAGVDDYIIKPFHLKELILRVRRMMTRAQFFDGNGEKNPGSKSEILSCGPFELDTEVLQIKGPTGNHNLTALEADILREFMLHPRRVLSREYLLEKVWGMRGTVETRTVDNFIVRLRRYLETDPTTPTYLVSVRGRGYRFLDEPNA